MKEMVQTEKCALLVDNKEEDLDISLYFQGNFHDYRKQSKKINNFPF